MKLRKSVVIDTSVFISALGWGGNPQKVLELIVDNKIILFMSNDILNELTQVLNRKKFDFISNDNKQEFVYLLSIISNCTDQ